MPPAQFIDVHNRLNVFNLLNGMDYVKKIGKKSNTDFWREMEGQYIKPEGKTGQYISLRIAPFTTN